MKITKREILLSIAIIAIMLVVGICIDESVSNAIMLRQQIYNTALQIDNDQELFEYGMRTSVGNAFVYGELKAIDPVTYPEIGGEYSAVRKVKERYTMHTRTVSYTENGKTKYRTETYWTWDEIDRQDMHSNHISFLNVPFDYGVIDFPSLDHIDTQRQSGNIRYVYYGAPANCTGTLFAHLKGNYIQNVTFYAGDDIGTTIQNLNSSVELLLFRLFWAMVTAFLVFMFFYFENNWLEDRPGNRKRIKHVFKNGRSKPISDSHLHT